MIELENTILEDLFDESSSEEENTRTETTYIRKIENAEPQKIILSLINKHSLWGHILWNPSIELSNLIDKGDSSLPITIKDKCVLELGAGAGLPSIISTLNGAFHTVLTDYNEKTIVDNLKYNVDRNVPRNLKDNISVIGHTWGKDIDLILKPIQQKGRDLFDIIIACDTVFNHVCHHDFLETCVKSLHPEGIILLVFTHHRPHKMKEDMNLFKLAVEEPYNFISTKLFEKKVPPMFKNDPGSEEVRSTIYFYTLKKK